MSEPLLQEFLAGVRVTHPAEWLAVATGLLYVVLIMQQRRMGWVFGGISAAILTVLAARARLPMNALLQFSYVVASVYGWWAWSRSTEVKPIARWHWRGHLLSMAGCLVVSLGLAQLLAMEGTSAFPFTDSLVACVGLVATWMVARVYIENWLYWMVVDSVSVYLFFTQGLVVSSMLFLMYLGIAAVGYFNWRAKMRRQAPAP